jgi:hypothetical protein
MWRPTFHRTNDEPEVIEPILVLVFFALALIAALVGLL